ncbi:MAG TPA: efflux RND transporter periplasmic adaptor subunit [Flavisolibacter sp.]|nr:efflux RND transporter periplasmic adaptor subunit [Flavisolibacter sp.]
MRKKFSYFLLACVLTFLGCKSKESTEDETEVKAEDVQTPVTVTTISTEALSDSIELNATSAFIQNNIVKSNINGYIKAVNVKIGQFAAAGKVLFTLQTKEAKSLGNTINKLDPSFQFTGKVNVAASQSGYVTKLMHQVGDYVQDGEQLATISDSKSFGFILNIPYEYRRYIAVGKTVTVLLPDGTFLKGNISSMLPTIDSASQTQTAMIKVNASIPIPENLIAKVRIVKDSKSNAVSLPKEAVLTNESQTSFWVMKMIDSVRAVKVPVIKGLETKDRIEIIHSKFSPTDKILLSGNYGLPDTARVKVVKMQ